MDLQEVLKQESIFQKCENLNWKPLNGGLSNETYIVTANKNKYVVKINFPQNVYLNLSRKGEHLAQNKAANMGITSRVFGSLDREEYTITEYIEGEQITKEEVLKEENLNKVVNLLKQIHSIKDIDRKCSVFDLIDGYHKGINEFKVELPDGFTDILKRTEEIRGLREKDKNNNYKYCHNDIFTNNLLYKDGTITVIDWELSGMGDPYMDLATLPYSIGFQKETEIHLLKKYFGFYDDEMLIQLQNMKYVGLVREICWALFYEGLNQKSVNHDMNYHDVAYYIYGRIQKGYLSF